MVAISSLVPSAADLLALEVEEVAGVLLLHLISEETGGYRADIGYYNFFNAPPRRDYESRQTEVNQALMEAWAWLQSEGFLIKIAGLGDGFFISRRAKRMKLREDFAAYRNTNLLPKGHLHPLIAGRVHPAFLRGEYDTAIFQAFREVEVAVRRAGNFPQEMVGDKLMRAAFVSSPAAGPLCDPQLPAGEQQAMSHLFAGAFGVYRNSTGHRHVPTEPQEAAEVIMFASQLLRIVDRLKPQSGEQ
jgi:uncharacterized protein (TIGR02391 family)